MKNIQIVDGAINSTFDIYQVSDEVFDIIFPNETDVAFIEDVEINLEKKNYREEFWEVVYGAKVCKKQVSGIHGTLHLTGSYCSKTYFSTLKESEVQT